MSFFTCPKCGHDDFDFIKAGMRIARGVSINEGIEHCRASIDCRKCDWYTCLGWKNDCGEGFWMRYLSMFNFWRRRTLWGILYFMRYRCRTVAPFKKYLRINGGRRMKIKCKKCLIVLCGHNIDFHDVEKYSTLQCGEGGTHIFVGVLEWSWCLTYSVG